MPQEEKILVEIDGRLHRLSARAIEILKLKKSIVPKDKPIELLKMPPRLDIIKAETVKLIEPPVVEPKAEPVVVKTTTNRRKNVRK
jgi:hypothetical protein